MMVGFVVKNARCLTNLVPGSGSISLGPILTEMRQAEREMSTAPVNFSFSSDVLSLTSQTGAP